MRPTSLRALHRVPSYADVRAYLAGNGFADFRDAALPLKAGAELLIGYKKDKTLEIKGFPGPHRRFSTHSLGRRAEARQLSQEPEFSRPDSG